MRAFLKSAAAAAAARSVLAAPALAAPAARSLASRYAPRRAFGGARNHLLATPPQGWMSWERFRCGSTNGPDDDCKDPLTTYCISSALVRGQAQAMAARGFAAAGYTLLSLDDVSHQRRRRGGARTPQLLATRTARTRRARAPPFAFPYPAR